MEKKSKRIYPRTPSDLPIRYAVACNGNSNQFRESRMVNYSVSGMCYETDRQLEPDAKVCVLMPDYTPGHGGPEGFRSYLTRVLWTEPTPVAGGGGFAAGVQIMARSHAELSSCAGESLGLCDLCGALMPVHSLQETEEDVQLCELCQKHYQCMPGGKIRECVSRFLVGNVV